MDSRGVQPQRKHRRRHRPLEQIQRQLTVQVLAVGDAADRLTQAVTDVPVDFQAANDLAAARYYREKGWIK